MLRILKLILVVIVLLPLGSYGQQKKVEEHKDLVEWMTLTEALEKQKEQPKKIFIDIYTDWCGWCKVMSKNTFSNKQIASYINQYFYPVRFDAETTDTIEYLGKEYVNENKTGKKRSTHQLAYVLTNNKPSYPTISYLDIKGNLIQALPGYMDVKKIEPFLVYFNENAYRSSPFDTFKSNFDNTYNDSIPNGTGQIQWVTFEDAEKLVKYDPKPIFIDIHTSWSITSKVMEATTYTDKALADSINKNFYAIHFDPTRTDTIIFLGKIFVNKKRGGSPFHDLALALTKNQIGIPATIYLNEKMQLLSNISGYRSAKDLQPLLMFFGNSIYKKKTWNEFFKFYVKNQVADIKK